MKHYTQYGMTLRDYFIAHAPADPQPWFEPVMKKRPKPIFEDPADEDCVNYHEVRAWDEDYKKQRYIQWPGAWADEQIKLREGD